MTFRQDIQAIRGMAILVVLLFHLNLPGFRSGFLGVDAFFVISGYLMAMLFDGGSPTDFYRKRIRRLLPAYAVTVSLTLVAVSMVAVPTDVRQAAEQSLFAAAMVPNIGFWLQNSYFSKIEFNPLLHLWSLGVEVQFYVIVPLLFVWLRRSRVLAPALTLGSLIACLWVATISPKLAFFQMPLRLWEFLLGATVAWWRAGSPAPISISPVAAHSAPIALVLLFFVPLEPESTRFALGHPGLFALLVCLLTAAVIAFGIPQPIMDSPVGRALTVLGRYSYSIYLVHWPIIVLANYSPFGGTRAGFSTPWQLAAILCMIAVASAAMFHFVEKRTQWVFVSRRPLYAALTLSCLSVAATAGNETRFDDTQRKLFSAWTDRSSYRCGKTFRLLHPGEAICELTKFGDRAERKVLLVGDSHADALKQAFVDVCAQRRIGVYFYVPNNLLKPGGIDEASVYRDAKRLAVDALVLHFSAAAYDDGTIRGIAGLTKRLRDEGVDISVIGPVPIYDVHVPRHLYEKAMRMAPSIDLKLSNYYDKTKTFWSAADAWTREGATVYATERYFCAEQCRLENFSGRPYYFDASHLTLTGARQLMPLFDGWAQHVSQVHAQPMDTMTP